MRHYQSKWVQVTCLGLFLVSAHTYAAYAQQKNLQAGAENKSPSASSLDRPVEHEDGTSLSPKDSDLRQDQPIVGEKAEFEGFTRELIQVRWRANDPIELYVIRPRGIQKPQPILYLYSYPSETNRFMDNQYCERITKGGFAAIGFVSALTGQRYHDRPMREWFVSELPEALTNSVHDVQMILNYLSSRGDFDLTQVGMFGQGSGGTIALLAATVEPRLHVLDLLDPWGDWPDWLAKSSLVPEEERSSYLKPEFLARLAPLDPVLWLPDLMTQTIRLLLVQDNLVTPTAARDRIAAVAPRTTQIVRYSETKELYQETGGGRLFDWIKKELKSPATAHAVSGNDAVTAGGESPHH